MSMKSCIILTNVPLSLSNYLIKGHFSRFGKVVDYKWIGENPHQTCTISLEFQLEAEAKKALSYKYHTIKEATIRCGRRLPSTVVFQNTLSSEEAKPKKREALHPSHPDHWTPRYVDNGN